MPIGSRRTLNRRSVLKGVGALTLNGQVALTGLGAGAAQAAPSEATIRTALGRMLMLGFTGKTVSDQSVLRLAKWLRLGKVGAVCFVKANVGSTADIRAINALFRQGVPFTPLIAIDHEGGAVQRLREQHGFERLPKAIEIAARYTPDESRALYEKTAQGLAALGFNLNLAPVVDLHHPANPVIGKSGRAYSADPVAAAAYGAAFVDAFAAAGVLSSVKHFPGHGLSTVDSHKGLPDISASWTPAEALPFKTLIAAGKARIIMTGHVRLDDQPATLSATTTTGRLRQELGFQGVILTDDLDMEAARGLMPRKDRVLRSLAAGSDMLMIQNIIEPDPSLPDHIADWVLDAVARGQLDPAALIASANRIAKLTGGSVAG